MDDNRQLTCALCGERIGVYERLQVERADGTVVASSYLNLNDDELGRWRRIWHWHCAPDASQPQPQPQRR